MDVLIVARETPQAPATGSEIVDPAQARAVLPSLPHGPQVASLLARLALGTLILSPKLDRGAARAAIGVAMQRNHAAGVVLLGEDLGRELLGDRLPLVGGIRDLHSRPVVALGRGKAPDMEQLLMEFSQRAGIPWSPPSSRASAARQVVRAEEVEKQVSQLMEQQQWAAAVESLRAAEPLSPRGTNMLGRALLQMGDREGARQAFERTLAADPLNTIAQRQIASL